jgi:translocator protein
MTRANALALGFVVVTVVYAAVSTVWVSHDPGWYAALRKPSFQPPDAVFGIIWPLNFVAVALVGVLVSRRAPEIAAPMLVIFAVSVCFALAWAFLFYVPHHLAAAAIMLGVAAVLTWVVVALGWRVGPIYGVSLLVYAAWMSIATALATAYARLN